MRKIAFILAIGMLIVGCSKDKNPVSSATKEPLTYMDLLPQYMDLIRGGWFREFEHRYTYRSPIDSSYVYGFQNCASTVYFFEGGRYMQDWSYRDPVHENGNFDVRAWGWYFFSFTGELFVGLTETTEEGYAMTMDHPTRWDTAEIKTWEQSGYPDVLLLRRSYFSLDYFMIVEELLKFERVYKGNEIVWVEYSVSKPAQKTYKTGCPTLEEWLDNR